MKPRVHRGTATGLSAWLDRIVLVDFLLIFLFLFDRYRLPGLPAGVLLAVVVALVASTRRPRFKVPHLAWYVLGYAGILAYLAIIAESHNIDWTQRILRFAILGLITWSLAEGRIDRFSAISGLAVALTFNAIAHFTGITPARYGVYVTGYFGDKNVAGLWYAAIGLLGLALFTRLRIQALWILTFGGLVYLTGSRTSIAAFLLGLAWFYLRPHVGPAFSAVFAFVSVRLLLFYESNFARIGVFSDREGTDWFREQIKIATQAKVEAAPWYGLGVGEGTVVLGNRRGQFFHSSYDTLRIEGGWPFAIIWVAAMAFIFIGIFSTKKVTSDMRAAEGSIVVILVCAWQLGEVFFTSIAFIAMGCALNARHAVPRTKKDEFCLL